MPLVPKFTNPQAKMIRTLEGLLVVGFNLAMVIVPIVSNALPAATAVKYAAIVNTGTVIARSLAKGIMGWQAPLMPTATLGEPILGELKTFTPPAPASPVIVNVHPAPAASATDIAAEVAQAVSTALPAQPPPSPAAVPPAA